MEFKLQLKKREQFGKKAKQLVREGQVLGNIYGKGEDSVAVQGEYSPMNKMIQAAGKSNPIEATIEGSDDQLLLVHDIERDAITQKLHHVTFQVIKRGQKVTTEVPIRYVGDAPAEKAGMVVVTLVDAIEIEAIPSKIPAVLEVSLESLVEENDSLTIADLTIDKDVTVSSEDTLMLAKVDVPRAQVEEEPEDEEGDDASAADVPSDHGSDDATESEEGK